MKLQKWILLASASMALMTMSCAKNRAAGGQMDDPQTHTIQGMKYWDKGEYPRARDEFKLAISLEEGKKYGPAYAGLAMADAAEGKYKEADDNADKAIDLCGSKCYQGHMAMAILIEFQNKGNKEEAEWWKDAEEEYEDALKIDPKSGELYFRQGHMYKMAFEFRKAEDSFRKNLDIKNGYEEQANAEWALVQKILRAEPGTRVGKRIALIEKITRADIAALFMAELELDRILDKSKVKTYENDFNTPTDPRTMTVDSNVKMGAILDIETHWARNFIQDVQKYRIRGLEPSADHKFYPDQEISRGEYAFFIEDILMAISGDRTLATKHIGATTSRFPDVNPSSPYYNAICNTVDKNIMDAQLNGEFRALDAVSGPDALLIIRSIKDMRR
jgi:hypothetical protein